MVEPTRQPTPAELEDVVFGWAVEQGVTSNSVIYVKDGCAPWASAPASRTGWAWPASRPSKAYTKYANKLCWLNHGLKYDELALAVAEGREDAGQDQGH